MKQESTKQKQSHKHKALKQFLGGLESEGYQFYLKLNGRQRHVYIIHFWDFYIQDKIKLIKSPQEYFCFYENGASLEEIRKELKCGKEFIHRTIAKFQRLLKEELGEDISEYLAAFDRINARSINV